MEQCIDSEFKYSCLRLTLLLFHSFSLVACFVGWRKMRC